MIRTSRRRDVAVTPSGELVVMNDALLRSTLRELPRRRVALVLGIVAMHVFAHTPCSSLFLFAAGWRRWANGNRHVALPILPGLILVTFSCCGFLSALGPFVLYPLFERPR